MKIYFDCPNCEYPMRIDAPPESVATCPSCAYQTPLASAPPDPNLPTCAVCGHDELFKKKDFPHSLGMGILVLACVGSTVTYLMYWKIWTWIILLGSAAFDGLLYLWVGDAIECYRCGAVHRGVEPNAKHEPFELTIHERFRQERLRKEEING